MFRQRKKVSVQQKQKKKQQQPQTETGSVPRVKRAAQGFRGNLDVIEKHDSDFINVVTNPFNQPTGNPKLLHPVVPDYNREPVVPCICTAVMQFSTSASSHGMAFAYPPNSSAGRLGETQYGTADTMTTTLANANVSVSREATTITAWAAMQGARLRHICTALKVLPLSNYDATGTLYACWASRPPRSASATYRTYEEAGRSRSHPDGYPVKQGITVRSRYVHAPQFYSFSASECGDDDYITPMPAVYITGLANALLTIEVVSHFELRLPWSSLPMAMPSPITSARWNELMIEVNDEDHRMVTEGKSFKRFAKKFWKFSKPYAPIATKMALRALGSL